MEKVRVLGSRIPNKFSPLQVTVLSSLRTVSTSLPAINWDHRLGVLKILLDWHRKRISDKINWDIWKYYNPL